MSSCSAKIDLQRAGLSWLVAGSSLGLLWPPYFGAVPELDLRLGQSRPRMLPSTPSSFASDKQTSLLEIPISETSQHPNTTSNGLMDRLVGEVKRCSDPMTHFRFFSCLVHNMYKGIRLSQLCSISYGHVRVSGTICRSCVIHLGDTLAKTDEFRKECRHHPGNNQLPSKWLASGRSSTGLVIDHCEDGMNSSSFVYHRIQQP